MQFPSLFFCLIPDPTRGLPKADLAIVLTNYPVTFACGTFQLLAIEHLHGATSVLDVLLPLKHARCEADARPVRSEHGGKKIVSNGYRGVIDAVLGHEQPTGKALLHVVKPIASGCLRDLYALNDGIAA